MSTNRSEPGMAATKVEEKKKEILERLREDKARLFLVGDAGVGKTWMAKKVRESALSEGCCYAVLWISMNARHDIASLHKNIACQLSVPFSIKAIEEADFDGEELESLDILKRKISEELEQRISANSGNRSLLLILDDEGSQMSEEVILSNLRPILGESHHQSLKLLITKRKMIEDANIVVNIEPLSESNSLDLFKQIVSRSNSSGSEKLLKAVVQRSIPSIIILIAEAINHFEQHGSWELTLERAFEDAVGYEEVEKGASVMLSMLPSQRTCLINCFWHCTQFFPRYGAVHYNELIVHWIMEGYFDPISHVEKAYGKGHSILMELLDRGVLKIQEDDFVIMDGAMQSINDCRRNGFGGSANVGLISLDGGWNGFGRITPANGMIKTLCSDKRREKVSTLLIDGSHLSRGVSAKFQEMKELEVLAVFDPGFDYLHLLLSQFNKQLLVLVLRGCSLLVKIDHISKLNRLVVLEVSGATSLEEIPETVLEKLTELQSLNLSGCRVKKLPDCLSNLSKLRFLILRNCIYLATLPTLSKLANLEVLDLSDSTSFTVFSPKDKNLSGLHKLQNLHLTNTQIKQLPILSNLQELTRLVLSGCKSLIRPSRLELLPNLQILDLSGATALKELTIGGQKGREQSHSATTLPTSTANSLSKLYLTGCSELKELLSTVNFTALRIFDVSGASSLKTIRDESFNHLSLLYYLNLSHTLITSLPSLSDLHNLRHLILRSCQNLEDLPHIGGLKRLKELDLSGCISLKKSPQFKSLQMLEILDLAGCSKLDKLEDQSFEYLSRLQKLALSETKIEDLSSVTSSINLSSLVMRNCVKLKCLPPSQCLSKLKVLDLDSASTPTGINSGLLENLTLLQDLHLSEIKFENLSFVSKLINLRRLSLKDRTGLGEPCLQDLTLLEELDFSDTDVTCMSSIAKLSNLRKLLLRNCLNLKNLPSLKSLGCLEKLDISGSGIKEFPYEISELAHLTHLDMENMKDIREIDWRRIRWLPEELNWSELDITNFHDACVDGKKPLIVLDGTKFFQLLNAELRERCLNHNFFSVCSPKQPGDRRWCHWRDDAYFVTREFPRCSGRSMQICGFNSSPTGMDDVLEQAEFISLVENKYMKSISSLGSNLQLRGCWVERCQEMERIFSNGEDAKVGGNLEILWLSNLVNLKSLCTEKIETINLSKLDRLHLDCCPELEAVFPSPLQLNNLRVLQVKFCDKLKIIFNCEGSVKGEMPKLQELLLLDLPELTSIGASLPPEAQIRRTGCPKLELPA